jgi:ribosome-binding factor A
MSKKNTFKKDKFQDRILNEINMYLRTKTSDSRFQFASITKVEVNPDYSTAIVYWDTFDLERKRDAQDAFKNFEGVLRSYLASVLNVRHVPEIEIVYDTQYESEQAITDILKAEADLGKK